jgi:hypothetical protein
MKFTALYVEAEANTATANVTFADPETHPDEPSVLMFSRAIDIPDSQYYFEINDQSYGSYGGLISVQLSRNSIAVQLESEVVQDFGEENFAEVVADFDVDDKTYQSVLEHLKTIFAGSDIFTVK